MQLESTLITKRQRESTTASYSDMLARHIGVLQHLQYLLSCEELPEATLADIISLITGFQQEYGSAASLEDVIQALICRHLLLQYQMRRRRRKQLIA